jgi:hypothetical protein
MELWDKAQARLESFAQKFGYKEGQRKRGKRSHYTEDYPNSLLGGLLYCGECGSRLHFVPENNGQGPYYGCPIAQSKGKNKGKTSCSQRGYVHAGRATDALSGYLREHLLSCDGWLDSVYNTAEAESLRLQENTPDECKALRKKHREFDSAIANLMMALETAAGAPEALVKRLGELEAQKSEAERALRQLEAQTTRASSLPSREWIQEQLMSLADVLQNDMLKSAKLYREFFGKVRVSIVIAPGKKRGHPVLFFQRDNAGLLSNAIGVDLPPMDTLSESKEAVSISLAGSDKLDRLMPTIDAMRRDGVEWREICSRLKIARSWANLYYNRWKKLTAEPLGEENILSEPDSVKPPSITDRAS